MDDLLYAAYKVSVQLLPILGVVVLIFVIVLLQKCIRFFKELQQSMVKVDKSLDTLQAPLETVANLSKSVDQVHDVATNAVKTACGFVVSNMEPIGEWVSNKFAKEETKVTKEAPQPQTGARKEDHHE